MMADYVASDVSTVTLKLATGGKVVSLPLDQLSEEDRLFVKKQSLPPEPKPLSPTLMDASWQPVSIISPEKLPIPCQFMGPANAGTQKLPVVIYLPSELSRDPNNRLQLKSGVRHLAVPKNFTKRPCLIFAPNTPGMLNDRDIFGILDAAESAQLPVDKKRVYLVGCNESAWGASYAVIRQPDRIAACVLIAGPSSHLPGLINSPLEVRGYTCEASDAIGRSRNQNILTFVEACLQYGAKGKIVKLNCRYEESEEKVLSDDKFHTWLFSITKP